MRPKNKSINEDDVDNFIKELYMRDKAQTEQGGKEYLLDSSESEMDLPPFEKNLDSRIKIENPKVRTTIYN